MANALDLLNPVPAQPAPKTDGTSTLGSADDSSGRWEKASALAPIANLGGLGLDQTMWQGGQNLYHATRPPQDVPQPIPEDVLWGTTGLAAPPLLATPRAPEAALSHLSDRAGVSPAFVGTLGQNLVEKVAAHANPGGDVPAQGANQAAAVALARFKAADEQGLLKGDGFAKAKETLNSMGSGVKVSLQGQADLVEAITRFEDATQWVAHPELAMHPLVGIHSVSMDASGAVKTLLKVQPPDGEDPKDRLAKAGQENPTALVDYVRAHLTDYWEKNVDEGDIKRWRKDKTFPAQTSSVPESVLQQAYKLTAHTLGVKPDEVRGLGRVSDEDLAKVTNVPQPMDWVPMAGTLDPADPTTFGRTAPKGGQMLIEVQPDGSQRLLGSWAQPLRGLAPTPATQEGLYRMTPAEPANIESVKTSRVAMDWNGFSQAIKPGSRLRIDAGGDDPEGDHRKFLASLSQSGVTPMNVGLLNPVTVGGEGHLPLNVEFDTPKDMHDAVAKIPDAYAKSTYTAYVDGPKAAPPGSHPAYESWAQDRQGRWGATVQPQPDMHSVAVFVPEVPEQPHSRIDDHASVLGTTPDVEVKTSSGKGPFAVAVNGANPSNAWLYLQPGQKPGLFYGPGQPPVDGAFKLSEDQGGVKVALPDQGDGKVDPVMAARVQSLLERMGARSVTFTI